MRIILIAVLILLPRICLAQFYGEPVPAAPEHKTRLLELLQSESPVDQYAALLALQAMGIRDDKSVLSMVEPLVESDQDFVRAKAVSLIASFNFPESMDLLIRLLDSEDVSVRRQAAQGLSWGGYFNERGQREARLLPIFLAQLDDQDSEVVRTLVTAIANMQGNKEEALPKLIQMLQKPAPNEYGYFDSWDVHYALSQIGEPSVAPLLELLNSPDVHVQSRAIGALADPNLSRHADSAYQSLLEYARRAPLENAAEAWSAVMQVGRTDPDRYILLLDEMAAMPVDRLVTLLPSYWEGATPRRILPAAHAALNSDNPGTQLEAVSKILRWGGPIAKEAVNVLGELIMDEEYTDRAMEAIGYVGDAQGAELLEPLLNSENQQLRLKAITALSRSGGYAEPYLLEMLKLVYEGQADLQIEAIKALAEIVRWRSDDGELFAPAVARLTELLTAPDSPLEVQKAALGLLGAAGASAKPAVPAMINALQVDELRWEAISALGKLGPDAIEAVGMISQYTGDPNLGDTAQWALKEILMETGSQAGPE